MSLTLFCCSPLQLKSPLWFLNPSDGASSSGKIVPEKKTLATLVLLQKRGSHTPTLSDTHTEEHKYTLLEDLFFFFQAIQSRQKDGSCFQQDRRSAPRSPRPRLGRKNDGEVATWSRTMIFSVCFRGKTAETLRSKRLSQLTSTSGSVRNAVRSYSCFEKSWRSVWVLPVQLFLVRYIFSSLHSDQADQCCQSRGMSNLIWMFINWYTITPKS